MHFDLRGPAGRLDALIDLPGGPVRAAAVLCHPHPGYGGTMRSRVLHEAAQGLTSVGVAVLRFNYRGVGSSAGAFTAGAGEVEDFGAAVESLRERWPAAAVWAAGYSFGAWVAMTAGAADAGVEALVGIAPPVGHHDFSALVTCTRPKFLIAAERDEVCPLKDVRRFYACLPEPRELVVIDGADHTFDGKAGEVGDAVRELLADFGDRLI
jgi:alpha/beta superfamily hydrolase